MYFSFLHSLAEGTLFAGLEVAPVHSPCPTEAQGQPEHQDRRHAAEKNQGDNLSEGCSGILNSDL